MELRSRSRSTTPLSTADTSAVTDGNDHSFTSHRRVLRSTKLNKASKQTVVTSDYSSEDGEHDISCTENHANHALEQKHEFHKRTHDEFLALKMYRDAKEYWNLYPKTDYTYSPHSKDRVELAPGVVNMPNMSRKSIHAVGDGIDYVHKETNTEPRVLFAGNNNSYTCSTSTSISSSATTSAYTHRQISIMRRIFYSAFYVLYVATRPLVAVNGLVVRGVGIAHWCASNLMMLDTWLLRSSGTAHQHRKLRHVLLLCLLPLFFFTGLWLFSSLGNALALVISAARNQSLTAPPIADVSLLPSVEQSRISGETLIKIQLDSPYRAGLTGWQIRQIAQSVKDNLNLNVDVETIVRLLMIDPNVQRLDESPPTAIAAALTKEQLASITQHLKHVPREDVDEIVEKVLESASIQNLIGSYNANDRLAEQEKLISELRAQLEKLREDLNMATMSNSARYVMLSHASKRCCRLNALQMEGYLSGLISAVLNSKNHKDNMVQWLSALFVAQSELELKLANVSKVTCGRFDDLVKESTKRVMEDVSSKLAGLVSMKSSSSSSSESSGRINVDELNIRAIVRSVLETYDADKTGLVDYALESAGGQILSTRCTEHYSARTSVVSIFGVPLWYPSASPRTVITPGVVPGECWAFQSFPGFVIIKLSHNVRIETFSYEHVSRHLIPNGRVDSAPRDFQVFGLHSEHDREPVLLGQYSYDALGETLQFFPVADAGVGTRSFQIVELKVNSNHGNPNYTCLYRFRVHGKLVT